MSQAIDDLLNEHEAILMALHILDRMSAAAVKRQMIDKYSMGDYLEFLLEFVDKCHHAKEEKYLFPALTAGGGAKETALVNMLLAEHKQGAAFITRIAQATADSDVVQLADTANMYTGFLRTHVQKENATLFPLAEKTLTPFVQSELYELFEEHEIKVIGIGRHEELHALLEVLHERYA